MIEKTSGHITHECAGSVWKLVLFSVKYK